MAKLYFYYSAMNAGKSTILLQSSYNYVERGMDTLLFTPKIDARHAIGKIHSRIGLEAEAVTFDAHFDLFKYTQLKKQQNSRINCIFIDESQFLTKNQVRQLTKIVDFLDLPVLAYGLRTDFKGEPFEGSLYLLLWADHLIEIKTICHCGRKAIMNARLNPSGEIVKEGAQIQIGGNETYTAMCRRHFQEAFSEERNHKSLADLVLSP